MTDIIIAGVGGQGTVLASKLLAATGIAAGLEARTAETIGMAQRGGSVTSHVRLGENICSPLISQGGAALLIAFEPAEAVRAIPYLARTGAAVVCRDAVQPPSGSYDPSEMLAYLGRRVANLTIVSRAKMLPPKYFRALNVALLGVAANTGLLPFDADALRDTLRAHMSPRYLDMNLAALNSGLAYYA